MAVPQHTNTPTHLLLGLALPDALLLRALVFPQVQHLHLLPELLQLHQRVQVRVQHAVDAAPLALLLTPRLVRLIAGPARPRRGWVMSAVLIWTVHSVSYSAV
jgi:hypothetical protein